MPGNKVLVGCDLVEIPRFVGTLQQAGLREKLFTPAELTGRTDESLAGLYAAKEAVIKALDLRLRDMFKIKIGHSQSGRPYIKNLVDFYSESARVTSCDISISHEKDYAMAVVVVVLASK